MLLAPTSPQRLFHEEAELATARAAKAFGTVSIASTESHYSFSDISVAAEGSCWFQLYAYDSRKVVEALLETAVQGKAKAVVVTMDAHYVAQRISATRAGFRLPTFVELGNPKALGLDSGLAQKNGRLPRLPFSWQDLAWFRRQIHLPLIVKRVLNSSDAKRCVDIGADGVIVSNHVGRQLDSAIPSIVALREVTPAVRKECVVLMDSGVRSGLDIVKAIALRAHAVCVGRPCLWGLAADGEPGVTMVLKILQGQLEDALLQLGLSSIDEIKPDCISAMVCSH